MGTGDLRVSIDLDDIREDLDELRSLAYEVLRRLTFLNTQEHEMSLNLDAITADVAGTADAVTSAVTLIQSIADELRNAAGDQAAIDALATQLEGAKQSLADAVVANTPAAPAAGGDTPADPAPVDPAV